MINYFIKKGIKGVLSHYNNTLANALKIIFPNLQIDPQKLESGVN